MIIYQTPKLHIIFADGGLDEVASYLKATPRTWSNDTSVTNPPREGWDFNTNYDKAWELARSGWTEGALNMHESISVLPPNEAEPEYSYDVAGYMPDVPLFCAGEPMHMMNYGHPEGRKPVIHLVINGSLLSNVSAKAFKNYGAAITAMISQIEATGRQVELDMVFCSTNNDVIDVVVGWKVKRAGDNLDLSAIAFSLAHPASARRLQFALMERTDRRGDNWGYGKPFPPKAEHAAIINAEGAFLFAGLGRSSGACDTVEGALRYVARHINEAAGETLVEVRD